MTCFGLLGGHHKVQQAIGDNISHGFKLLDFEISSSIFCMAIYRQKNYEVRSCEGVRGALIQTTRGVGTLIPMSRRTGGRFVSDVNVIYVIGMVSTLASWPRV